MSEIVVGQDGLYQDGKKLKLEFGNLEQIAALRKFEKKCAMLTEGVEPNLTYTVEASARFTCMCGRYILVDNIDAEYEDDIMCFEGHVEKCNGCNRKYKFIIEREYYVNSSGKRCVKDETLKVKLQEK